MPSNIPLWTWGVAFRLRLVTFTEQAHRAYRPLGGRLPCSVFCSRVYPATDTGFRTKNRPTTGLQPFSD